MATTHELRLPTGHKARPDIINADDAALGDVLTVEDDGSGGKRTALKPPGTDPGVPLGTPGNLALTLSAGDGIVSPAHSTPTVIPEFDVTPTVLNLTNVGALKLVCPTLVAGPTGTKITLYGIRFDGDTPTPIGVSATGPSVPVDVVNSLSGRDWANQGDYFDVDESFQIANVHVVLMIEGGDDEGEAIFGNVQLFAVSVDADTPPDPENPGPEIPQSESLIAEWIPVSGQSIPNAIAGSGGLPPLMLGSTTGSDSDDGTFASSPPRITTTSYGSFQHQFCRYVFSAGEAAALPDGFAIFVPFRVNSGGADKFVFGIVNPLGGRVASFFFDSSRIPLGTLSTSPSTSNTVGTTTVDNGEWNLAGLVFTGSRWKIVMNGVVEGDVAVGGPLTDTSTGTYIDFGWAGTNLSFAQGPDSVDTGTARIWIASGMNFSDAELAEMYAAVKLTYTALP